MRILTAEQIRAADQYTIEHEPISSIDLMERASVAFVEEFVRHYDLDQRVAVFSGTGNNGGDGLAVARLLHERGYTVSIWICGAPGRGTPDFLLNYGRLPIAAQHIEDEALLPNLDEHEVVIDGLFGSGLNRPLTGLPALLVQHINQSGSQIVSIDVASGLYIHQPVDTASDIVTPNLTISFQLPKLAFFQPKLSRFVGDWSVVDIGLSRDFINDQKTHYQLTEREQVRPMLPRRTKFMHKGNAGRVAIWAGSSKKTGAGLLSAQACLRSGAGLLWMTIPEEGQVALNVTVPEAMTADLDELLTVDFRKDLDVLGIGPGVGTDDHVLSTFERLLSAWDGPLVLDADAITLVAQHSDLNQLLPKGTILTPHPGEFRRLVGDWSDDYDKLGRLRDYCQRYEVCVVLKGAFSAVCDEQGQVFFNPTGNAGMATAGSGDVLFGIVCGLRAQGMSSIEALRLGVYLHGLAGDHAKDQLGENSLLATDIIRYLPNSFMELSN